MLTKKSVIFLILNFIFTVSYAEPVIMPNTPQVPNIRAKAYILIDAKSGKVIAEKDSEVKLPPASLTKMMTLYVLSNALSHNQVKENDLVRVSKEAWQTGGSRMFIKEGDDVSIKDLMNGIIVDSGNDACVAIAEHLGGSEPGFADVMNQQAKVLGMNNSHFTDSTGLPNEDHYTTAKDLAILGRALINDFPQYYSLYKQKWFTFNNIKQPNRNRLLWRNDGVDGIKTGHTEEAGFCLVSSAEKNGMRLISVLLGAPSDSIRADDSSRLLNYGFRFFETKELLKENQLVKNVKIYKGNKPTLAVGSIAAQSITIPKGKYENITFETQTLEAIVAPINKGDNVGNLLIRSEDEIISTISLYALEDVGTGGTFHNLVDSIKLKYKTWRSS